MVSRNSVDAVRVRALQQMHPARVFRLGAAEKELRAASEQLRVMDVPQSEKILRLLSKVADTFSQIGCRRLDLLMRLRRVAKIAAI